MKAVDTIHIALPEGASRNSTTIVATISSDGKLRLYDLAALPSSSEEKTQLEPIAEYDTKGTRLTCLTLADGDGANVPANGKRKRGDDEDEDEEVDLGSGEEGEDGSEGDSDEESSDE